MPFYRIENSAWMRGTNHMKNQSRRLIRILAFTLALMLTLGAPALAERYSALVSSESASVYADAALTKKLGTLDALTIVTVGAEKNGVAAIQINGNTAYVSAASLTAVQDIAIPATVSADTFVYAEPSTSARSVALKAGVTVNVLAVDGNWAMIEKNGRLGYAYTGHLSAQEQEDASVTPAPDAAATTDPFLPDSAATEAAEAAGVTVAKIAAMVNVSALPVYKSANTSAKRIGTLSYGQTITVYAYNSDWAYIGLDGNFGFCALAGLKKTSGSNGSIDLSDAVPAVVKEGGVKVYQSASSSSKSLGTLKAGTQVNIVKTNSDWAYIELAGNFGYCQLSALEKTGNDNSQDGSISTQPKGTCTVITATAEMTTKNGGTLTLKAGDTLNYYGYDSKRVLVGINGTYGYVSRSSLNADSYAELTDGDSGSAVAKLETTLLELGYLDTIPSINFSSATAEAVKRFQAACGMTQTGKADVGTQRLLYSGNAPASPLLSLSLSSGSTDVNVSRIQTRLLALGYLSKAASVDGQYGTTTAAAIRLFQKTAGGSATGNADNKTIRALYSGSAPSLPSGSNAADYTAPNNNNGGTTPSGMPSGLASTTSSYSPNMSNAQKLEYVIYVAQQQLGKRYVFGSAGTATFDCSGLTLYCFKQVGVTLAHSAYSVGYSDKYPKISGTSSLRRGDLVFFNTMSDGDLCDHTGIYLGSNYFIHASSGAGKVVVSSLGSGYYNRVYSWGRRVLST